VVWCCVEWRRLVRSRLVLTPELRFILGANDGFNLKFAPQKPECIKMEEPPMSTPPRVDIDASAELKSLTPRRQIPGKVTLYTGFLVLVAGALSLVACQFDPPPGAVLGGIVGFVILLTLFGASEMLVLHLHIGESGYTFSVTEATLVVALFHAPSMSAMFAQVIGGALVLAIHRKQKAMKILFNSAMFAVESQLAFLAFRAIGNGSTAWPLVGFRSWFAAYVSVLLFSVVGVTLVFVVIFLADAEFSLRALASNLRLALVSSVAAASIGISGATLMYAAPPAALLLVVPIVGVFWINRTYLSERKRTGELEFLQESSQALMGSTETDRALPDVLEAARAEFCVQRLELEYLSAGQRTTIVAEHLQAPIRTEPNSVSLLDASPTKAAILSAGTTSSRTQEKLLVSRSATSAVIAPLVFNGQIEGVLFLGNPLAHHDRFDSEDVRMAEMLVHHVAAAMQTGRLEQSVAELRGMESELLFELQHEPLTGLFNRSAFTRRVRETVGRVSDGRLAALCFVDLDDFKSVNDTRGHATGDLLLRVVGQRLQASMRSHDYAARLGGDEFAVLLHPLNSRDEAASAASRLLECLREPIETEDGEPLYPSVSIGISMVAPNDDVQTIFARADSAMYRAKGLGKGRVEFDGQGLDDSVLRELELGRDLERAIGARELELSLQGIHPFANGAVHGFAAVLQWNHPIHGVLLQDSFAGTSTRGQVQRLLRQLSLEGVVAALEKVNQPVWISMSLTAPQLLDATLIDDLIAACSKASVAPQRIRIEVDQRSFARSIEALSRRVDDLRTAGFSIVLANLGLDHTTVGWIERLKPVSVKLSPEVLRERRTRPAVVPFIRSIVELGRDLGFDVVADGVEASDDAVSIGALGCRYGQGNFLSVRQTVSEIAVTTALLG
jgi:diguanylate cyclase (GGDEF)-like protein